MNTSAIEGKRARMRHLQCVKGTTAILSDTTKKNRTTEASVPERRSTKRPPTQGRVGETGPRTAQKANFTNCALPLLVALAVHGDARPLSGSPAQRRLLCEQWGWPLTLPSPSSVLGDRRVAACTRSPKRRRCSRCRTARSSAKATHGARTNPPTRVTTPRS